MIDLDLTDLEFLLKFLRPSIFKSDERENTKLWNVYTKVRRALATEKKRLPY